MKSSTYFQSKEAALTDRKWRIVDADGVPLGRLATEVAALLRGKNKPTFTPHVDSGDYVIVINAEKVRLTGRKFQQKKYRQHSGYVGGLKEQTAAQVRDTFPERLVERAVKGMLPKGRLGVKVNSKLKVYAGTEHPHGAQQPEPYALVHYSAQ